jgi:all-trans-retinol 13,14-reductase
VNKIIIDDGKATSVELADGHRIRSDYVVSNADARQTFLKLVGQEYLRPKFISELSESRLTPSAFLVSLGVDMDLGAMGFDGALISYCPNYDLSELFGSDPENCRIGIKMHSLLDPEQAPVGMHTVQLLAALPHDYMGYWRREKDGTRGRQYKELKESVANKLIASVEKIIPGLSEHIVYRDIATPLTFERFTLNSGGAMAGWYPAPVAKIRSQRTPIKNLFQAGHWTFPGGTVAFAIQSGRNAAQMVLREAK